ncbi:PLP-dependent aminotransferase family protein [Paenibacillus campinasensis]|uniref:GntR family transcriptional regulator n=1 Tax=Paenibacillus campinasensis TaxID=66347 RepID=A0A268EUM6_9BACL|nr:PLP-dependent aminotransferase family protein [Paenibacillus campinasensis]PAD76832.1 GntR family transcriptional regulator [Paenibacillus campinasensis]
MRSPSEWDTSSRIPLYQQIYEDMKDKIMSGEWPVGTRIPSQRQLAAQFAVNRSTVIYALDELIADGLLEARVGKGTVVVNNTWNALAAEPPPDWNHYVQSGSYQPNIQIIQQINDAETNDRMIRLGTGELSPELLPAQKMKEIFSETEADEPFTLGYSEPKGSLRLREVLSEHLRARGIETSPAGIMIVSGGLQALQLISLGLLHRGSTVLLETPSYLNSVHVFQSAGMSLQGVPMDDHGIRTDTLARLKRQHNAALLYTIPSFHNPTGILMTAERRKALLQVCTQERLPIIEDDVYRDLWFDEAPPPPLKALDRQGMVLHIGSMSKTLGPGLRIGWIAGPEPVINRLADIKMQTDYGSSSLSQFAVARWLATGQYEQHLIEIRAALKQRRDLVLNLLEQHFQGLASWTVPQGGFYIWLHLMKKTPIRHLFEQALKEGLLLNPGQVYDRQDRQHLRLSYAYASLEQLEFGLQRLADLIQKY